MPNPVLLLDSGSPDDARLCATYGLAGAITTNPALLAERSPAAPLEVLEEMLDVWPGEVFYQPVDVESAAAEAEVRRAHALAPGRVIAKLPPTPELFGLAARLGREGLACAITAVYAPAQVVLATAADCRWVIPYVDRARRLRRTESPPLVPALAAVAARCASPPAILAASLKSPEQAVQALIDGADAITVPLPVLSAMAEHPLSQKAIDGFAQAARVHRRP